MPNLRAFFESKPTSFEDSSHIKAPGGGVAGLEERGRGSSAALIRDR